MHHCFQPVSLDHRLQHLAPAIGAVNVAGTQGAPLQIAELVEQEKGTGNMTGAASKTATPSLPFPWDVSFRFWTGTGLSVNDATDVGLSVAFK